MIDLQKDDNFLRQLSKTKDEELDEFLIRNGYDPQELLRKGQAVIKKCLKEFDKKTKRQS